MLKLKYVFTGTINLNNNKIPCFLEIYYNFELNNKYNIAVNLAIQQNKGDPIVLNGLFDPPKNSFNEYDIFGCALKKDVIYGNNTISFSIKNYVGSIGFLRNYIKSSDDKDDNDEENIIFKIDDCCLTKFKEFVDIRNKVNM